MQCPACLYDFTFYDSFKVLSPYRCPCPACKLVLTLGKQANRFALVAVLVGASAAAAGIYLAENQVVTSAQALAAGVGLLILGAGIGEWHFWKHGVLCRKGAVPT